MAIKTFDVLRVVQRANSYPLHVRVAARIVRDGYDQASFRELVKGPAWRTMPQPLLVAIENSIRDIECGFIKVDSDLHQLTINL